MKKLNVLKNQDFVEINGEKYQVIRNTGSWFHTDEKLLEMQIGLVKFGEKDLEPSYYLTYFDKYPERREFHIVDKKSGKQSNVPIKSLKY